MNKNEIPKQRHNYHSLRMVSESLDLKMAYNIYFLMTIAMFTRDLQLLQTEQIHKLLWSLSSVAMIFSQLR